MKLLDTTFLIDFLKGDKSALLTISNLGDERLVTTSINIFETLLGIYLMSRNMEANLNKFRNLLNNIDVLPFNLESSFSSAHTASNLIKSGQEIDDLDSLIAGVMKANNIFEIVTRDKHFSRIKGIKVVSY